MFQGAAGNNFQTFSFGSRLNFEVFVQYREYIGFAKCMDALKGKKLVMKESDGKALAATIKVSMIAITNFAVLCLLVADVFITHCFGCFLTFLLLHLLLLFLNNCCNFL